MRGVFSCANGHKKLDVKSPGFNHADSRFQTIFTALPLGLLKVVFSFHRDIKIVLPKKPFRVCQISGKQNKKCIFVALIFYRKVF